MSTESKKYRAAMDVGHLALGMLVAKDGLNREHVVAVARGLRDAGSESTYVASIIERADGLRRIAERISEAQAKARCKRHGRSNCPNPNCDDEDDI